MPDASNSVPKQISIGAYRVSFTNKKPTLLPPKRYVRGDIMGIAMSVTDDRSREFLKRCEREDLSRCRIDRYSKLICDLESMGITGTNMDEKGLDDAFFYIKNLRQSDDTRLTKWKMLKKIARF